MGGQSNTREDQVGDIEAILRGEDNTGVRGTGGESQDVTHKGMIKGRREATGGEGGQTGSRTGSLGWS